VRLSVRPCVRVFYDRQTTCSVTLLALSVLTGFAPNLELSMPINSLGQPHCDISFTHACRLTSGFRGPRLSLTDFHQIWNKDSFHIFKPELVCDRKRTVLLSACAKIDISGCFEVLLRMLRMQMKNQPRTSDYRHQIWHVNIEYYKAYPYNKPKLVFGHARNSSIFTLSNHWMTYSVIFSECSQF